ncbi:hypothetical protein L914_04801 [Phytophthora nicotianae]|uniref:Uncharacterized protein n=1 Tax=Phytophthora nicotianae TaxID=4792 RepID=W2NTT6_PHYNI|nr:hypothetical protein L914_04801 [Phytophthora nicotianae]
MSTSPYPFTTYGPQNYGLGYFSPADCTDAGINCTYQRFPNFDFLRQAFASFGQPLPVSRSVVNVANNSTFVRSAAGDDYGKSKH